jgi:hypothetical protein
MSGFERRLDLPLAVWLGPLGAAVGGVVAWTAWCSSPSAVWIGAALIVMTGLLTFSLVLEGLPHAPGWSSRLRRTAVATLLAVLATLVAGGAAFLGLYLRCPFF